MLASSAKAEHVDNSTSALVMIEYQNEWVSKEGRLRNLLVKDKSQFEEAINRSKTLLALARKQRVTVIHVTLKPDPQYRIFGDAAFGLRAAIPDAKTWQGDMHAIHADFKPHANEHVITERTGASGFSGSNLDSYLRNNGIDTLFLAGFATHVCVESTLREAHDKGYRTFVVTDAVGAFTELQQSYFENDVLHHFGHGVTVNRFEEIFK